MTDSPDGRLLETFLDLVRIDSPPGEEAACAQYCAAALEAQGCEVFFDESSQVTGSDTGNLIAYLPGTAPGVLLLSAHLDCVEPCKGVDPVIRDGVVYSSGDTILGADDKVGLAAAIECVRRLREGDQLYPSVRCVFTVQEEVGLTGAKELAPETLRADLCLVLDADGAPGGIVIAAPTHYTFFARFIGRAAHAGVRPEDGISAIAMATEAISGMTMGRVDADSTANVGTVHGGTATNVIAAQVDVTGECRSLDAERVEDLRASMDLCMRTAAAKAGGAVDITWKREYAGFRLSEEAPIVDLVRQACVNEGLEARTFSTGGGSDANVIAALGVPTVALSCGMSGVHGTDESIAVDDLGALTRLCVSVARRLAIGAV